MRKGRYTAFFLNSLGREDSIENIKSDVEDIPVLNFKIYRSNKEYDLPPTKANFLGGATERTIIDDPYSLEKVEDYLRQFFDNFPYEKSLTEQAAFWMRWFAGMHFFEDANHRTGMSTLRITMENNGIVPPPEIQNAGERVETAIDASERVREEGMVTPSNMYEKDGLYEVWYNYFDDVL